MAAASWLAWPMSAWGMAMATGSYQKSIFEKRISSWQQCES
jgi:hypothetical protein